MDFPGLLALLLMLLEWTRPSLLSPLRPICDLRVLNHFIKEAQDAEVAMKSCRDGCSLSQSIAVPQTTVDFDIWEMKNAMEKSQEVQCGLWLLQQALNLLRSSVTNVALHGHIDNSLRNVLSINAVLHSLNIPDPHSSDCIASHYPLPCPSLARAVWLSCPGSTWFALPNSVSFSSGADCKCFYYVHECTVM
ncbi:erythropoietin isoform X2 [Entelurus aequoreus]|uniref:erythropoietin isoform X2 n=1 Tax=Entelurus aequoreus TaxID=161455 RepID=UPI002B1DA53B|nr:erythropoietin isoform X2 [Entelurus aequoreus]